MHKTDIEKQLTRAGFILLDPLTELDRLIHCEEPSKIVDLPKGKVLFDTYTGATHSGNRGILQLRRNFLAGLSDSWPEYAKNKMDVATKNATRYRSGSVVAYALVYEYGLELALGILHDEDV